MESKVHFRSTTAKPTLISFSSKELRWLDDYSQAPKEVRAKLPWRTFMKSYVHPSIADADAVVDAIVETIQPTIKEHPATAWIVRNGHTLAHSLDRLPDYREEGTEDVYFWTSRLTAKIVQLIMQVGNIGNNPRFYNLLDYPALPLKNPNKLAIKCLNTLAANLPLLSFLTWHQQNNQLVEGWLSKWMTGVADVLNKLPIRIHDLVAILYSDNKNGDPFAAMAADWPEAILLEQDALRTELWRRVLLSKGSGILRRFEQYGVSSNYFRILGQLDSLENQASHNLRKHLPGEGRAMPNVKIAEKRQLSIRELLHAAAAEAQAQLEKEQGKDEKHKTEPDHRLQFIPSNLTADPDVLEEVNPEDVPPSIAQLQKDFAKGGILAKIVKLKNCPCARCKAQASAGSANPNPPKAKDEPTPLPKRTSASTSVSEDDSSSSSSSSSSEEPGLADLTASAIAVAKEQTKE